MNLSHLQSDLSARRDAAARRKASAVEDARSVLDFAKRQRRDHLTAGEDARLDRLIELRDRADRELEELDKGLAECAAVAVEEAEYARQLAQSRDTPAAARRPAYDRVARVGREQRTYNPETDRTGSAFLLDIARDFLRMDPLATDRLARHAREEEVERGGQQVRVAGDALTSNFAGLTVPQYLTDLYAPAIAAGRPFANICNHHDLPPTGMTINISQITTATSAAIQSTQLTGVSATSIDDTLLTENVQTVAGQQTLSRQAIERGTISEDVTTQDLFKRVASALDSMLLTQATTGIDALSVGTTTALTSTAPTIALLWPKLFAAQNLAEAALLSQAAPSHFIFHPRRWNWATSQVSTSWPMFGSAGVPPQLAGMTLTNAYDSGGVRGILANGMKILTDANVGTGYGVGTNEDRIYCVAADECHLFEPPNSPILIRAEQPAAASLGVILVAYQYVAYCFRRYSGACQSVSGTGLVSPVFG